MSAETITLRGLNRATLARQLLLVRERLPAPEAIDRLAGIQAQEPRPPFVGLWTRLEGFTRQALLAALRDREVVRATWLRATLHLVSARDYLAFRTTLAPMLRAAGRGFHVDIDLDRLLPAARELLADGPRTFDELRKLLSERFPEANERGLGYLTRLGLPLVMAVTDDPWGFPRVASFTLASDWLGAEPEAKEARAELLRRYLAAFGPATAADMQTWSGLGGIREVLAGLRDELVDLKFGRKTLYDLPDAPRPDEGTPAPVRFLPAFDNLVLAHADRTRVLADEHRPLVVTRNLRVHPTFLMDGFVAGTWTTERAKGRATLRIRPFEPLPAGATDELVAEGEALVRFAEPDATTWEVRVEPPA